MNYNDYRARPSHDGTATQEEYKNGLLKKQKLVRLAVKVLRAFAFGAGAVALGAAAIEADPVAVTALGSGIFSFVGAIKLGQEYTNLDKRYHTVTELDYEGALYSKHPSKEAIAEEIEAYDRNADIFE